jgi:tetrahydromethanopterin S-methyltransferase subunit H
LSKLKEVEVLIQKHKRQLEKDGGIWDPDEFSLVVTQEEWRDIQINPYILELFGGSQIAAQEFINTKKLFGVKIEIEE